MVLSDMGWRYVQMHPTAEEDQQFIQAAIVAMRACLSESDRARLAQRMLNHVQRGRPLTMNPWEWFHV